MRKIFASSPLEPSLREPLVKGLAQVHADHPLLPNDPRGAAARVAGLLDRLGWSAVVTRGRLGLAAVEIDHVWLAVSSDRDHTEPAPWVLDAVFPLHEPSFLGSLPGYVAGTTSREELSALAAAARIEDRVLGEFPPDAVYWGTPGWGGSAN
ncbi:hypothetical protein BH24ACT15_BH24ACT15_19950 [soil metagenome]|jgi:hypothetical protein